MEASSKRSRAGADADEQVVRILFVGNSFLNRNNVPETVAELASAKGVRVECTLIQKGGASLKQHWNAGKATELWRTGGFSHLVLQEQSTLPIKGRQRFHENVRLFAGLLKETPEKRLWLYSTWCRKGEPENQSVLDNAYRDIAEEAGATVIPVGPAFGKLKDTENLYDKDGSHCNESGSYLAACVIFATMFSSSPEGLSAAGHKKVVHAPRLQKAAWEICKQ